MNALFLQLEYELSEFNEKIETVFIGGGTPSTIEPEDFEKIFNLLNKNIDQNIEITTEANPNSATFQWLKEINSLGVNRLSLGVQSFNDSKLKNLGRNHTVKNVIQSIENAKKANFQNISIDLIYNTIWDNKVLINSELDYLKKLDIQHVSAYSLTIEENTIFSHKEHVSHQNLELSKYFLNNINSLFSQYEISNFGKKSMHNYGYWQHKNYIGVGAGAVGFINNQRFYTENDPVKYIQNPFIKKTENLSKNDLKVEKIFLGLRSDIGVELSLFNSEKEIQAIKLLENENLITLKNNIVYNNDYFLSDEIALKLI
jgi:oxygen-independent coproporphyrinogen-3 oxidase